MLSRKPALKIALRFLTFVGLLYLGKVLPHGLIVVHRKFAHDFAVLVHHHDPREKAVFVVFLYDEQLFGFVFSGLALEVHFGQHEIGTRVFLEFLRLENVVIQTPAQLAIVWDRKEKQHVFAALFGLSESLVKVAVPILGEHRARGHQQKKKNPFHTQQFDDKSKTETAFLARIPADYFNNLFVNK